MSQSELRLIKHFVEYIDKDEISSVVPRRCRGIYVLYRRSKLKKTTRYNVVYVGMAAAGNRSGIRGRLMSHRAKKGADWTHFSAFAVWDNIRDEEIVELEGLFRHIYRHDADANGLNIQRGFKKLHRIRRNNLNAE